MGLHRRDDGAARDELVLDRRHVVLDKVDARPRLRGASLWPLSRPSAVVDCGSRAGDSVLEGGGAATPRTPQSGQSGPSGTGLNGTGISGTGLVGQG